jgi:hypothetical protein
MVDSPGAAADCTPNFFDAGRTKNSMTTQLVLTWALFVEGLLIIWHLMKIRNSLKGSAERSEGAASKKEAA